jgi:hypothetical protein
MAKDYSQIKIENGKIVDYDVVPLGNNGYPEPTKVKFSLWKQEWKDAYYAYRKGNKPASTVDAFAILKKELEDLKANKAIMAAIAKYEETLKSSTAAKKSTKLSILFGSENPVIGTVTTFLEITARDAEGNRAASFDSALKLVQMGRANFKYDLKYIKDAVKKLNGEGHDIIVDETKSTVTFNK